MEVREGGDGKIVADAYYFLFAVAILPPRVITVAILPPRVIMGISMDVYNFTRAGILPQFFFNKEIFFALWGYQGETQKIYRINLRIRQDACPKSE